MHVELEQIIQNFVPVLQRLTASQCQQHPGGDTSRWSVQQNIAHLVLTYDSTTRLLQKRVDAGEPLRARPTLKERIPSTLVIGLGIFPRGQQAPEFTRPEHLAWEAKSGADLMVLLREGLAPMDAVLTACEARFGCSPVGAHFIFGPLTARQWRRFHAVHGELHLQQVKRTLKANRAA